MPAFRFADFDDDLPALIAQLDQSQGEWEDTTWGNDTCPSIRLKGAEDFAIWVDYKDPALSDFAEDRASGAMKRFIITQDEFYGPGGNYGERAASDNWSDIVAAATRANFDKWREELRFPKLEGISRPDILTEVYEQFCTRNTLPHISADELAHAILAEDIRPQEKDRVQRWLQEFIAAWKAAEDADDAKRDDAKRTKAVTALKGSVST